jgi:hypothetical protein
MSTVKFTKTATFLFPLTNIPKSLFECNVKDVFGRTKFTSRFINAFCSNTCILKYQDEVELVFILTKQYQDVGYEAFYTTITSFPNYVDDYDDKGYTVFIFKIPEENLNDYNLLMAGKYSEISRNAKKLILGNNFFTGKAFTLPLILNKSEALKTSWEDRLSNPWSPASLKDQEVWPIINSKEEILSKEVLENISLTSKLVPSKEF